MGVVLSAEDRKALGAPPNRTCDLLDFGQPGVCPWCSEPWWLHPDPCIWDPRPDPECCDACGSSVGWPDERGVHLSREHFEALAAAWERWERDTPGERRLPPL